jgi:group I intron endonuclease
MLIWQTWFQKPLKALSANILGTKTITGIYKITNIETGECYIGQASDIATRWAEHAKCGLGIDTPANNKLYQAMQEYGLWSFSWELLEECPRDLLNEKEKYYIELYDSYNFGYNSNHGVGK